MKSYFKIFITLTVLSFVFGANTASFSQPPPPPPSVGHGMAGNAKAAAGAPIGEGMFLLIGLAGLYGGFKINDFRETRKKNKA